MKKSVAKKILILAINEFIMLLFRWRMGTQGQWYLFCNRFETLKHSVAK